MIYLFESMKPKEEKLFGLIDINKPPRFQRNAGEFDHEFRNRIMRSNYPRPLKKQLRQQEKNGLSDSL